MSQPDGLERFSGRNFLLERNLRAAGHLVGDLLKNAQSFAIRVCIFGGLLGVMWTLSNLQPDGDLAQYLTPFLLFSFPIVLLGTPEKTWQRLINFLILLCFWGIWGWAAVWYFRFPNYQFVWLFLSLLLLSVLTWVTARRRRNLRRESAITQALQLVLWAGGLSLILLLLGFLVYFVAYQVAPEPGTANILAGGMFVFFLTLTILRVFLLDSMRYRRADRMEHVQPDDAFLFLEWLIPRSYSFLVVLGLLLVSEAMMFSTIYHTFRRPTARVYAPIQVAGSPGGGSGMFLASSVPNQARKARPRPTNQRKRPSSATSSQKTGKKKVVTKGASASVHRTVGLMEWVLFAFKPYVFPKHEGREVDAPQWFKYLGRALLGLIIAILLTQQLTIWKQFYNLYLTLVGIVRRERHEGETLPLKRQKEESLAHMASMLNIHASPWRRQILYACTVPSQWIGWMLVLDPSTAFWEGLGRVQRAIVERWDVAMLSVGTLLLLVCTPFSVVYRMGWLPLLYAALPSVLSGALMFLLRTLLSLRPPKLYQFWIWWLLLVHLVFSLVLFFLTLSLGTQTGSWHYLLWYGSLLSILVFPAVYIFGGERHRRVQSLTERVNVNKNDSDVTVRRLILTSFFSNQHRRWLLSALTTRIHPVRGAGIKMRLILPSLIIGALDAFRVAVETLEGILKKTLSSLVRSLLSWIVLQLSVLSLVVLSHLLTLRDFFSASLLQSYLITLACLVGPGVLTGGVVLFRWLLGRQRGEEQKEERHPLLLVAVMFGVSFLSVLFWMVTQRPFSGWGWLLYSLAGLLSCTPWVAIASELYRLRKLEQQSLLEEGEDRSDLKEKTLNVLERLAFWLAKAESDFLNNLYRRSTAWKRTELAVRDTLIRGCVTMLEEAQRALVSGSWYDEEEHAIKRVYLQWLTDEPTTIERTELAEELAYLTEQVLDTLSSLVFDLEHTHRFEGIEDRPDLDLLLDSLVQVLRLPRSFAFHKPEEWQYQEQLLDCLEAIQALALSLYSSWEGEPSKQSQRAKLLSILGALNLPKSREVLREFYAQETSQEVRLDLLRALGFSKENEVFFQELVKREDLSEAERVLAQEALLCLVLPSPLATLYSHSLSSRELLVRQREAVEQTSLLQRTEGLLEQLQTPDLLYKERKKLSAQKQEQQLRLLHARSLRTAYFSLFGFLIVSLKDVWEDAPAAVLGLEWDTAEALQRSVEELQESSIPEGHPAALVELLLANVQLEEAHFLESACQKGVQLKECQVILRETYAHALAWVDWFPVPVWQIKNLGSEGSEGEADSSEFRVLLQGVAPTIGASATAIEQEESLRSPIGRGLLLLGTQPRPHLEFYISLWFLQLLHELAHSDGLLQEEQVPEGEHARNDRLLQVEALTNRFGRLLAPYSPEQQRILARLFDSIGRRLTLLKNLTEEEIHSIDGKGLVDFSSTLQKLTKFLDGQEAIVTGRLNNLLYLNLLPSREFLYLVRVEDAPEGELRWYLNPLTQELSVQLYENPDGMADSQQRLPAAGSSLSKPSFLDLPQVSAEDFV